ncbi:MAG TPA: hypothetical protein VKW06_22060 [Candidatus Angelobacter sp.]|nr:hypothetical protein [Candidatus Angelobacter sp.]
MRKPAILALVLLVLPWLAAQETSSSGNASDTRITDEIKQLRQELARQQQMMIEQQKQMAEQLRLANEQRLQIARQQGEIERLQQHVAGQSTRAATAGAVPHLENASLTTPAPANIVESQGERPKESPLSFRIGGMDFTPGGFVEFENIFRTTNSGSIITTNFGTIPFSNSPQGHLTEDRLTGQFSRLNLQVTGKFGDNDVTGYAEMDFNGNDAAGNVFITGNSHTFRERLFWVDVKRNKWEVLGGQTWSFVTPNRRGVSPMPSDLAITYDEDGNVQVGIPYTRAAEFRLIYHANEHFAAGLAIENPEQITGAGAGEVAFPNAFNAQLPSQFAPNNTTNTVPNAFPDLIPKIAYDTDFSGRHFHAEALGLLTTVKVNTLKAAGTFQLNSKTGGSVGGAMNFELLHNVRFLANVLYGEGSGHYDIGLGPTAVVHPDGTVSLVHGGSGLAGFEYQPVPKTLFALYYGAAYFQRNFFLDTSAGAKANTFIGFGGPNSANSNNRSLQQPTFDWTQTFWRNPQYGALQLITQTSYLTRSPWFVALGAPKNAHLVMVYTSMRYVLP